MLDNNNLITITMDYTHPYSVHPANIFNGSSHSSNYFLSSTNHVTLVKNPNSAPISHPIYYTGGLTATPWKAKVDGDSYHSPLLHNLYLDAFFQTFEVTVQNLAQHLDYINRHPSVGSYISRKTRLNSLQAAGLLQLFGFGSHSQTETVRLPTKDFGKKLRELLSIELNDELRRERIREHDEADFKELAKSDQELAKSEPDYLDGFLYFGKDLPHPFTSKYYDQICAKCGQEPLICELFADVDCEKHFVHDRCCDSNYECERCMVPGAPGHDSYVGAAK